MNFPFAHPRPVRSAEFPPKDAGSRMLRPFSASVRRALFPAAVALLLGISADPSHAQSLKVGSPAPEISANEWLNGSPVQSFESGKHYVVEFWATWCPPCIRSIPHLNELQKKYGDQGVTVIGVAASERGGNADRLRDFAKQRGMEYPIAYDRVGRSSRSWMMAAGRTSIPTSFLVNGDGKIAWIGHPMQGLEKALESSLASATKKLEAGDPAPKLEITRWLKGQGADSFEEGKTYVVEFWATWCPPCVRSIPHLTELQKQYEGKVEILGIAASESNGSARLESFVNEQGDKIGYSIAYADAKAFDPWMTAADRSTIPTAFVVDPQGNVAWIGHPLSGLDEVLKEVTQGAFNPRRQAKLEKVRRQTDAALEQGDWNNASAGIDELLELDAASHAGYAYRKFAHLLETGAEQAAYTYLRSVLGTAVNDQPEVLNAFAWFIVKPEETPSRDLSLARLAAERANQLTDGQNSSILDTLARVYYLEEQHGDAVQWQRRAVELARTEESNLLGEFEGRLADYERLASR